MKKWTPVNQTLTPDGKTISLFEHDGSYTIRIDGVTLMSTRQHASEEKIGELACAHMRGKRGARVLIGGLGFGYTLKAVLAAVAPDATVIVAEILAAVIAWNRNPSLPLAADDLGDPRVNLLHQDVREVIRETRKGFDSIVLDVDNGAAAMSTDGNAGLYDHAGLQLIRTALRPEGCVGFWSAGPDPAFEKRMARAGFVVEVRSCRAHSNAGPRHTLILGRVK